MPVPVGEPVLLMTPGPTRVPERVRLARARPMIHHRSPEFSQVLGDLVARLSPLFGTKQIVMPVHTTGRGAMEAVLCNLFRPGDEILVCANGRFGELWATIAESHGIVAHRIATDWSQDIDLAVLETTLRERPAVRAVTLAYCDTSTGVENDVRTIARIAASRGVLSIVDGVSALGGMPYAHDEWGVDASITASQKCLMSTPGVAFAVLSERAWAAAARATLPRGYWDFQDTKKGLTAPRPVPPGTPPIHAMLQVSEALRMIEEEGLERVFARHAALAERTRAGTIALGLPPQCPALRRRSTSLTACGLPAGVDPKAIRDGMRAQGIEIAAGLGRFENVAIRIGHMGDIRMADVDRTLDALAVVMRAALRASAAG